MVCGQTPPRKVGPKRRAGPTALAFGASVLGASWCRLNGWPVHAARWAQSAFAVPRASTSSASASVSTPSMVQAGWPSDGGRVLGLDRVPAQASKGFAPAAAAVASKGLEIAEPEGGWPKISVIVLNPDSKDSQHSALTQLAYQDYPLDRIHEVVVSGASELGAGAPENLQNRLRDLRHPQGSNFNLHDEFAACGGDYVVVWGDDQVSPSSRLRAQVSAAAKAKVPTLLKQSWFFDTEDYEFQRVTSWPLAEFQDIMKSASDKQGAAGVEGEVSLDNFAPLMVYADPLTLCGQRDSLVQASSGLEPIVSPADGIKELLWRLLAVKPPQIIEDLAWALRRPPPSVARFEKDKPESALLQMAHEAWPRGKTNREARTAFDDALKEVQALSLPASAAITKLLSVELKRPLPKLALKKVTKAIAQNLAQGKGVDASAAVETLKGWEGLQIDRGDEAATKKFPLFYACFAAVRAHVEEDADLLEITVLGELAQGLVQLAMKMWAADSAITEVLVKLTAEELQTTEAIAGATSRDRTADICGTLGLKKPLEAVSYAALDIPEDRGDFPVSSLAALAWALAEAGVENGGLQNKVAKGIINNYDKLSPPDIGYIFSALHERQWFKDDSAIEYLTKALVQRVQELKAQDAGLKQSVESQAAAFVEKEKAR